jgi:hypothetical protein
MKSRLKYYLWADCLRKANPSFPAMPVRIGEKQIAGVTASVDAAGGSRQFAVPVVAGITSFSPGFDFIPRGHAIGINIPR